MNTSRPLRHTLRQLEYFVAVADRGSFGAAARACAVSQPALSAQVALLEEVFGAPLFERSRPVRLTAAGERAVARAREVLRSARAFEELGREYEDPTGGVVNVGVIPSLAPYLLPRLHGRLDTGRLDVNWHEAKTEVLERLLGEGGLDLAILATLPARDGLDHRVVGHEPFVAVLPGRGPARPVHLAELADQPVLLLDEGHCFREQAHAVGLRHALSPSPFRATSLATLVQMVGVGHGATLLPACAVAAETSRADVHACPIVEDVGRDVVLAWRRSWPREALVEEMVAAVTAVLAG